MTEGHDGDAAVAVAAPGGPRGRRVGRPAVLGLAVAALLGGGAGLGLALSDGGSDSGASVPKAAACTSSTPRLTVEGTGQASAPPDVLTAVLDSYAHIGWWATVVPFTSSYHRAWVALGTIGVDLLLAVAISSALRRRIPARAWRALHWLAYLSWPVAVSHTLGLGPDTRFSWALAAAACNAVYASVDR